MNASTNALATMQQAATERTNVLQSSICHMASPNDSSTHIALGIAVATLPICGYFIVRVWKAWVGPTSKSSACKDEEVSESHSFPAPFRQTLPQRWRGWVQRRCKNQLNTLLLGSWIVLTLDQLNLMLMLVSYQLICPESNCTNGPELITHHCPGGFFLGIMLHIQPLGSCLFVVATINRFVHVYKVLSQGRARLLKAGTIAVVAMLVFRWMSLLALYWVGFTSQDPQQAADLVDAVWLLHDASLLLSYSVFAIADLVSLALGLHYILQTRKEVKKATTICVKVESVGFSASFTMDEGGGSNLGQDSRPSSSQSSSSGPCNSQTATSAGKSALWHKVGIKRKVGPTVSSSALRRQYALHVTVWTLTAMVLLFVYLLVQLVPGVLRSLHAQVLVTVMTLVLKVFAGSITLAISSMTRLVLFDST